MKNTKAKATKAKATKAKATKATATKSTATKATATKATATKSTATKSATEAKATKSTATKSATEAKAKHTFRLLLPSGESSELVANRQVEVLMFTFSDGSEMALTKEECAELGSQGLVQLGECIIVRK